MSAFLRGPTRLHLFFPCFVACSMKPRAQAAHRTTTVINTKKFYCVILSIVLYLYGRPGKIAVVNRLQGFFLRRALSCSLGFFIS